MLPEVLATAALVGQVLRAARGDAGCGATCAVLERYVEAEVAGHDAAAAFPGVAAHLGLCRACRRDHDGLLAAVAAVTNPFMKRVALHVDRAERPA